MKNQEKSFRKKPFCNFGYIVLLFFCTTLITSSHLKIRACQLFCGHLQSIFQYFKPKTVGSLNLTKCSIPLRYDKVPQVPTYPPEWMEHKLCCAEVNFFKLCSFPAGTCLSSSAQQSFGNYGIVLLGLWKATWKSNIKYQKSTQ